MPRHDQKAVGYIKMHLRLKLRHTEIILRQASFQRGVADMRAGRRPCFDDEIATDKLFFINDVGHTMGALYEYGRQFGAVAPRDLPLMIARAANPAAIALLKTYFNNGTLMNYLRMPWEE